MLVISVAVLTLVCSVSAAPREKRFAPYPYDSFFPTGFPFTGRSFNPLAGMGFPFGFQPIYVPMPVMPPLPDFSKMIPWYKGPNVCEKKVVIDEPDEMKAFMDEGFGGSVDFTSESQNCRGINGKYACMRRIMTNEGSKVEMTKYECCYGFVPATDGSPGCVESSKNQDSGTGRSAIQMQQKEQYHFNVFKGSLKDKSGVESVPVE